MRTENAEVAKRELEGIRAEKIRLRNKNEVLKELRSSAISIGSPGFDSAGKGNLPATGMPSVEVVIDYERTIIEELKRLTARVTHVLMVLGDLDARHAQVLRGTYLTDKPEYVEEIIPRIYGYHKSRGGYYRDLDAALEAYAEATVKKLKK